MTRLATPEEMKLVIRLANLAVANRIVSLSRGDLDLWEPDILSGGIASAGIYSEVVMKAAFLPSYVFYVEIEHSLKPGISRGELPGTMLRVRVELPHDSIDRATILQTVRLDMEEIYNLVDVISV